MKIKISLQEDIFLMYPELLSLEKSISLIKETYPDNSVSKIFWSLILDFHPRSVYKNLGTLDRRSKIEIEYLDFELDWKLLEDLSNTLREMCLTKAERYLYAWEQKLDERQALLESIPYSLNNYEDLDKMMAVTDKMWKQYQSCLKDVLDEESKLEGEAVESISEQKLI
jgi:hypothetical protein